MNSGHPATAWDENKWFYGRRTESISRQPNVMNSYILTQRRCAFSTSYRWCGSFVILRVIIHIHLLAGRRPLLCFRIPIYKLVETRDNGISWERRLFVSRNKVSSPPTVPRQWQKDWPTGCSIVLPLTINPCFDSSLWSIELSWSLLV